MSSTTTRLGLYLPGGGSTGQYGADETADIDKLNANFVKLDQFVNPVEATLATLNANTALYPVGARVSVAAHTIPGNNRLLRPSVWQKWDGATNYWEPVSTLWMSSGTDGLTDLGNYVTGLSNVQLLTTSECMASNTNVVYRWAGYGNLPALDAPSTAGWQAWHRETANWVFNPSNFGVGTAPNRAVAQWGINAGRMWVNCALTLGTSPSIVSNGEVFFSIPFPMLGEVAKGNGTYAVGGATTTNSQVDLILYPINNPAGYASTTVRMRARWASAASASIKQNALGTAGITPAAGDGITFELSGTCGAYA